MDFEKYKRLFDESFSKMNPYDFVKEMEELGYKFSDAKPMQGDELKALLKVTSMQMSHKPTSFL